MVDLNRSSDPDAPPDVPLAVVEDEANQRFVVQEGGVEAELVYRRTGDTLTLVHTGVPDELGGRGIGGLLVSAAVDAARRDGLTIAPWCPFARSWLLDHPEVADTVALDLTPPPGSD